MKDLYRRAKLVGTTWPTHPLMTDGRMLPLMAPLYVKTLLETP
jgi:hypothetical protein